MNQESRKAGKELLKQGNSARWSLFPDSEFTSAFLIRYVFLMVCFAHPCAHPLPRVSAMSRRSPRIPFLDFELCLPAFLPS